jgi:hypothetical protein
MYIFLHAQKAARSLVQPKAEAPVLLTINGLRSDSAHTFPVMFLLPGYVKRQRKIFLYDWMNYLNLLITR